MKLLMEMLAVMFIVVFIVIFSLMMYNIIIKDDLSWLVYDVLLCIISLVGIIYYAKESKV